MIRIVSDNEDPNSRILIRLFEMEAGSKLKSRTEPLKTYLRMGHFTCNFTLTLTNPKLRLLRRLWQGAGKILYSVTTEIQSKTTHIHSVVKLLCSEAQARVSSPLSNGIRQRNKETKNWRMATTKFIYETRKLNWTSSEREKHMYIGSWWNHHLHEFTDAHYLENTS